MLLQVTLLYLKDKANITKRVHLKITVNFTLKSIENMSTTVAVLIRSSKETWQKIPLYEYMVIILTKK